MLLIIEDNLELVNLYKIALQLVKIEPEVEVTGPAALRRIQDKNAPRPEAVILDLHLRKENGIEVQGEELFNEMRQVWPGTRIVVVSADKGWCQKFIGNADAVVEKPIANMLTFLDTIQGFLNSEQPALV